MFKDRFGQPTTTASACALGCYDEAVDRLFALQVDAEPLVDQALAYDADFALGHCTKARARMQAGDAEAGRDHAHRARELAQRLSRRERQYVEVVFLALHGRSAAALEALVEHASAFPRDPVPLSFALGVYGLYGFGGYRDFTRRQVALLESVESAWGEDDWWYQSARGWAHVEDGRGDLGIPMLDRALDRAPYNANAVHGRAHGYYERGAAGEGEAFVEAWLPSYPRAAPLHGHLCWHLALFALQRGDMERALAHYRGGVSPAQSQALPMFTLIDGAAFAARCAMYGHPLSDANLAELTAFADERFPSLGLPFVNVHRALLMVANGNRQALQALCDAVEERSASPAAAHDVALDLSVALRAFVGGDYGDAANKLENALSDLTCLGGSGAQRDVFVDAAIAANRRAGRPERAQELAAARSSRRAGHLGQAWLARLPPAPQRQ